ncbi:MAG: cytochrome c, class I [Gammaproteobacteria bacterium]|nr:cytochrome c, class I [Gammaproteobacteria bacterium]
MKTNNPAFHWLAAVATSLALSSTAQADSSPAASLQIQVLSGACANCHGTDGRLGGAIPVIAGRPAAVLESQLLAFKRGEEPKATVMTRHASGYTDDELAALADYFSKLGR